MQLFPFHCNLSSVHLAALHFPGRISFGKPAPSLVQDGEVHASNKVGSIIIPKVFLNQTKESKEAAKELTVEAAESDAKADANAEAKDEATKAEQTAEKLAAVKLVGTKQKIKKQAVTGKQKTAAPANRKEDAPVKRCIVSFPGARVVLVSAALFFTATMALRSNSSMSAGAAEVVTTKSVSCWADASNDQQCKMHDNNVRNDFCAVQETTSSVRIDFPVT